MKKILLTTLLTCSFFYSFSQELSHYYNPNKANDVYIDYEDNLMVSIHNDRIFKFNLDNYPNDHTIYSNKDIGAMLPFEKVLLDLDNDIWFIDGDDNVYKQSNSEFVKINQEGEYCRDFVLAKDGSVWLTYSDKIVIHYRGNSGQSFIYDYNKVVTKDNEMFVIYQSDNDKMAIYNANSWFVVSESDFIIKSIYINEANSVFFVKENSTQCCSENYKVGSYYFENGLQTISYDYTDSPVKITNIVADSNSNVYCQFESKDSPDADDSLIDGVLAFPINEGITSAQFFYLNNQTSSITGKMKIGSNDKLWFINNDSSDSLEYIEENNGMFSRTVLSSSYYSIIDFTPGNSELHFIHKSEKFAEYNVSRINETNEVSFLASTESIVFEIINKNGDLFFRTIEGMGYYDGTGISEFGILQEIPTRVTVIEKDSQDNVWAGGYNGLAKFDGVNWDKVTLPEHFDFKTITAMYMTQNNVLWVITNDRYLSKFENEIWSFFEIPENLLYNYSRHLTFDGTDIFMGDNPGFLKFNVETETFTQMDVSSLSFIIRDMVTDNNGVTYVANRDNWGVNRGGLFRIENNGFVRIDNPNIDEASTTEYLRYISIDENDIMWLGYTEELALFDGTDFVAHYPKPSNNLPDQNWNRKIAFYNEVPFLGFTWDGYYKFEEEAYEKVYDLKEDFYTTFIDENIVVGDDTWITFGSGSNYFSGIISIPVSNFVSALGIEENELGVNELNVFPNPVSENKIINFNKNLDKAEINVYSLFGQKIYGIKSFSGDNLKLSTELSTGYYFLHIDSGDSITKFKILIQ
ncbi:T9SS type A sorting domain-containing protein [uncultured Aquimarina sp.]|uniref:T9SS type A sorting domain-containing protein n=1 Tax=uncultured Aquimarina sp. TaxID=575652 RepID=UPI0026171D78|nr:T9SS type A sorting domain-containing protein [uncultured Aquimarina sp.]